MSQGTRHIHEELVLKCQKGDDKSRFKLYKLYAHSLYNSIVRIVPNTMDAEDVLQETFIKAFEKISQLEDTAAVGGWLKKIAVNTALNFIRKRRVYFEEVDENTMDESQEVPGNISMELIHQKIKALPDGCRLVLSLFLLEGYQHREIAEMLSISESTSKTQYRRAKQLLRNDLKKDYAGQV